MAARPTGLDQSWGFADPKIAAKAGVRVVSMYVSWDGSKNITARDVKAYHKAGIGVMLNWENNAGAPLAGAAQARADATEAVRQARQLIKDVGYPPVGSLVIYFSCDRDVNAGQFGTIFSYYREAKRICHEAGFGVGAYGEASLVSALARGKITDAEWQTYAWSNGVLSPDADFFQYLNGQTLGGASVDFDRIIHADQLGAWWPPGRTPTATSTTSGGSVSAQDVITALRSAEGQQLIRRAVWQARFADPTDPTGKRTYTAGTYLVYGNLRAKQALSAVTALGKAAAVDSAAVAVAIRDRLVTLIGGHQ